MALALPPWIPSRGTQPGQAPVKQRPFMGARSCWAADGVFWLQELLGSYYGGCRQCLWDLIGALGGLHVHA